MRTLEPASFGGSLALAAAIMLLAPSPAAAIPQDIVVVQGLDKVTARISTFEVKLGQTIRFGTLAVTPRACDKRPPEEPPENTAFIEIDEIKQGEGPIPLMRGWMFSSSPGLNGIEHAVYDVWVLDCKTTAPPAPPPAPPPPARPGRQPPRG